ncbi:ribosomal RNA small subunit methyltransferase F [Thermoclostridium stercorarium subsp. stercorarium DSM 8532]|uniref:Ribosomal RNA small subunit methyltransferase F n=3 Tax=Thermoclostridium stercorarium TaxID=1510 RepID=L7VQ29_THES1|nr:ribosomal RNA small subunit methyltransferase F [Thermoclostridium stercorarium subsp. stercorarium DSM 8532]
MQKDIEEFELMRIPAEFENKFRNLMDPSEFDEFISALNEERVTGLRINSLKIDLDTWEKITPFEIQPVPWSSCGFYIEDDSRPGTHPYYHAGLYYIQEPSAMFPAEVLAVEPGDRVLDLCAAPGGKTVALAAAMKNQGFLLSNDINPKRIKALVKNIELCGITNAVVTNETPEKLSGFYEGFFSKILLDVPCSGEGMFRKDADAVKSWNKYKAEELQVLQREIFDYAYRMLSPGGRLVYSTCTFNPEENEQNIAYFLKNYPDLYLVDIPKKFGIEPGRPDWADGNPELLKTARLWPHRIKGEGHFVALFARQGEFKRDKTGTGTDEPLKSFVEFCERILLNPPQGIYRVDRFHINIIPPEFEYTEKLRIIKTGLYLGEEIHGKFEPSQAFAMALDWSNVRTKKGFSADDPELIRYLKGETLFFEGEKGYILIGVERYPLGWGKMDGSRLKNMYAKGWRKTR